MSAKEFRLLIGEKGKKNKYNAQKTKVEGITFDSKKEARRYADLKLLAKQNEITALMRQVPFDLAGVTYKADFVYFDVKEKKWIVEDVKGMRTREYKMKAKQMKTIYDIEILET